MLYSLGQKFISLVDAQGLRRGETYTVVGTKTKSTFLGGFTTVLLEKGHERLEVGNPHLVLKEIA